MNISYAEDWHFCAFFASGWSIKSWFTVAGVPAVLYSIQNLLALTGNLCYYYYEIFLLSPIK